MTEKKFDLPITRYPDGKAFIGNTIDGKPDGTGWMFDEPKYYGDFKKGLKHGTGRLFFNNGMKIVAEFKEGKFHGKRTIYDPNKKCVIFEKLDNDEILERETYMHDGTINCIKYQNGKKYGIELLSLKDGAPIQIMYENGERVKHPQTGDINGSAGDPDPEFLNENIKAFNHHKERMEKEIIWRLPDEVTEQINDFINKKKN